MPDYDARSLELGIEAAKKNIKTFEDAISRERETITNYYAMIEVIQNKKRAERCQSEMTYL